MTDNHTVRVLYIGGDSTTEAMDRAQQYINDGSILPSGYRLQIINGDSKVCYIIYKTAPEDRFAGWLRVCSSSCNHRTVRCDLTSLGRLMVANYVCMSNSTNLQTSAWALKKRLFIDLTTV